MQCLSGRNSQIKEQINHVRQQFDDPRYDTMLDNMFNEGEPFDWNQGLLVNDQSCSLRVLVMTLSICFDDTVHHSIIPELMEGMRDDDEELTLNGENIQDLNILKNQNPCRLVV